ncbi:MAG: DUF2484 family protein [Marinibacterium sp.]
MTLSIVLFCLWLVVANVIAMLPSRDHHWTNAYVLIAVGGPLLIYLAHDAGWLAATAGLIAAMSVLRWPVLYLTRWLRRQVLPG